MSALICTSSRRKENRQANADLFRPAGFKLMWLLSRSDPCVQMPFFAAPALSLSLSRPSGSISQPDTWPRTDGVTTLKVRAARSRLVPGGTASKTVQSPAFLGK